MTPIRSFDVFDTVLVRSVADPADVFLLLGRRLRARGVLDVEPARFAVARTQAEDRARARRPGRDTTLRRIHEELRSALRLDDDAVTHDEELQLERELLRPVPSAAAALDRARREARVVFTSDTPLPEPFLREMLTRHGLLTPADGLYVSSSHDGANKATGALYRILATEEGVDPSAITHTGDNAVVDVRRARAAGLDARHVRAGNLTSDERLLQRHAVASGGLASALAGAARLARLQGHHLHGRAAVLRDVAASVAGPSLVAFVLWVLAEARRAGTQRLYFLAREGQMVQLVAERLVAKLGLDLDLRYLEVSRQSLNLAAVTTVSTSELSWALTNIAANDVRTILARVGIDVDEVADELAVLGYPPDRWTEIPSAEAAAGLLHELVDGPLRPHLEVALGRARTLVLDYLEQEGVFDDRPIGLVDTSGAGSQQRAIEALRRQRGLPPPVSPLLYRKQPDVSDGGTDGVIGWFEDQVRELGWGLPAGRGALLEVFCAADHGTVLGYERRDGRVVAVHAPVAPELARWGSEIVRRTVLAVAEAVVLDDDLVDTEADVRAAIRELLERLWTRPTAQEAAVWGAFPFEGGSGSEAPRPLATPFRLRDVAASARLGQLPTSSWFAWEGASEQLSPAPVRLAIRAARLAKHRGRRSR